MTIKDAILAYISASASGVADSDLRQALGVKHHAQVNQRCRELAAAGLIERRQEETGIRNYFVALPRRNLKSRPPVISDQAWFWEGNVQAAVVRHLVQDGFNVVRVADTSSREHGKDIVVRKDGRELWVSVKGRPAGTERTTPFTQARNWFYGVFFEVCAWRGEDSTVDLMLALPEFITYRNLSEKVSWLGGTVNFSLAWVQEDGTVAIERA